MKYYIYDGNTLKYLKTFSTDRERKYAEFCLYRDSAIPFSSRYQAEAARTLLEPEYSSLMVLEMPFV